MIAHTDRRETDAAIAHDRGGHAVLRRRRNVLAPGHLAVVMGVDVDETRRDQSSLGVDFILTLCGNLSDLGDAAVLDRDIGLEQLVAAAIRDRPAADHEVRIVRHGASSRSLLLAASSGAAWYCQ